MSFGLRVFAFGEDREAGAIPALPRNCKRENRSRSLGAILGSPYADFGCSVNASSLAKPGDRRKPSTL